jgi:hypothetical protein
VKERVRWKFEMSWSESEGLTAPSGSQLSAQQSRARRDSNNSALLLQFFLSRLEHLIATRFVHAIGD